ncbi:MAG: hypothetical protein M1834_005584 [Cirrosporium novae-zelandiae]|nr:MAG: hypothetical protein M1834_005584 [Cirrosporium novae-zelandiae]
MGSYEEPESNWRKVAARRRQEIEAAIPESYRVPESLLEGHNHIDLPYRSKLMSPRELQITEHRAVDLVRLLRERTYTAVEVTTAFCKRAAIAHQATNCLAAVLFDEALKDAAALDDYMQVHGKPKGPLHGLPISVKEHIYLAGTFATSGLIAWADSLSPGDALIVKVFRDAGAVFHVKTTNPQTLMAIETESNLYGRTVNPYNTNLTSGGSSGGEGSLIAMRGSVLGIGTDIGGSIRVPSAFCGLYGLKASVARLPHSGLSGLHNGMQNIIGCVGPIATCIADLRLFCETALAANPWDHEPSLIEIPWRTEHIQPPLNQKLVIGVMWNDGVVQPHPPLTRALRNAVAALKAAGHTVIDWDPKLHAALAEAASRAYFLDGGREYTETLAAVGEPPVPAIKWLLESQTGKPYTVEETWKLNNTLFALQKAYTAQWTTQSLDVLLTPPNPSLATPITPAPKPPNKYWSYTSVFNALDYVAAVFPTGTTVQESDTWSQVESGNGNGNEILSDMDREMRMLYPEGGEGPKRYRDAPISLQVVGRRLREEKLLGFMECVEGAVRGSSSGSGVEL